MQSAIILLFLHIIIGRAYSLQACALQYMYIIGSDDLKNNWEAYCTEIVTEPNNLYLYISAFKIIS